MNKHFQGAAAPRMMRVAQMTAFRRPLQVVELPVAVPRPDGAVVRVEASGVCRSDWHFWNQDLGWMGFNLALLANTGHEVGGVVEEVGCDVRTIKVGDRVTIPFHESDGTCPHCRAGYQNLCDHVNSRGPAPGRMAQYVTVTAADLNCIKLPDGVDTLSAAALGCRFMTAYRAVIGRGRTQPGEWIAVHGCGGVDLSALQIAAAADTLFLAVDADTPSFPLRPLSCLDGLRRPLLVEGIELGDDRSSRIGWRIYNMRVRSGRRPQMWSGPKAAAWRETESDRN